MMTIKPMMVLLGTILALALALRSPAHAGASTPTPAAPGKTVAPGQVTSSGQETLESSIIQNQVCPGACFQLAKGYNRVFTTTMTCPYKSCTFGFQDMIQVGINAPNPWKICAEVNGKFVNPPCPDQGIGIPGYYSMGTSLQSSGPVGPGTYTLAVSVYVTLPTGLANCQIIYRLYTP
jgi:hypothetical protein